MIKQKFAAVVIKNLIIDLADGKLVFTNGDKNTFIITVLTKVKAYIEQQTKANRGDRCEGCNHYKNASDMYPCDMCSRNKNDAYEKGDDE
jgi:hypothetical protein